MLVMSSPTQQDTAQPKNVSAPARASLILKDQEGICIPRKLIKETLDNFAQGMRKFTTIISSLSLSLSLSPLIHRIGESAILALSFVGVGPSYVAQSQTSTPSSRSLSLLLLKIYGTR